jgi:hypothetical protein
MRLDRDDRLVVDVVDLRQICQLLRWQALAVREKAAIAGLLAHTAYGVGDDLLVLARDRPKPGPGSVPELDGAAARHDRRVPACDTGTATVVS